MRHPIIHLLKPKDYRVWCLPNKVPSDLSITSRPGKATCCNCLTAMRRETTGRRAHFRSSHTFRVDDKEFEHEKEF